MNKFLTTVIAFVFVIGLGTANAAMIDFETGPDSGSYTSGNFVVGDATFTNLWVLPESPTNHIALQASFVNTVATITFANAVQDLDFDFQFDDTELYLNGGATDLLQTYVPTAGDGYTGTFAALMTSLGITIGDVTSLKFVANAGSTLIDNITYSATPIPGAAWLLGSGLIGLVGLRRKFLA